MTKANVVIDGAELRIMAHLSEDPGLLAAFASGQDVHRATVAEVFGVPLDQVDSSQRRAAKAINFGLMYGMSAFGLARQSDFDRSRNAKLSAQRALAAEIDKALCAARTSCRNRQTAI